MKKFIIFFAICVLGEYSFGQSISSQVIASTGDYSESSDYSISWTLGEIAIETLESSAYILTQGFHQGYFEITSVDNPLEKNVEIKVYPNPATDYIFVSLESDEVRSAMIELYDLDGRIVLKENWDSPEGPYPIDLSGLTSAQYLLKILTRTGKPLQTFKIIKR